MAEGFAVVGVTRRQERVNGRTDGVKEPSAPARLPGPGPQSDGTSAGHPTRVTCLERCLVADLLYAILLIGVFVVLGLTLRGLEKL
jgi:hypothetical protein